MRTTVTLDPDVEQLLRDAMQQRRQSFKEALNQAIRAGLSGAALGVADRPFTLSAQPMGLRTGIDPGRLNQLADELESDAFAELSQRLLRSEKSRPRRRK
ncbi:MAG: antitoxin [Gammaproteobacteria bacterium]|nr:antitoxin [Gammaproteobacteria bacterium]